VLLVIAIGALWQFSRHQRSQVAALQLPVPQSIRRYVIDIFNIDSI
jgi:hypothetical protein